MVVDGLTGDGGFSIELHLKSKNSVNALLVILNLHARAMVQQELQEIGLFGRVNTKSYQAVLTTSESEWHAYR